MTSHIPDKIATLGAIYTPDNLSEYVAKLLIHYLKEKYEKEAETLISNDSVESDKNKILHVIEKLTQEQILDPSSGDGSLLLAFEKELDLVINELINTASGYGTLMLEWINSEPVTFGYDIDDEAVVESSKKLLNRNTNSFRKHKVLHTDSIVKGMEIANNVPSNSKFSSVIANPPWGVEVKYSAKYLQENGFKMAKGQFDSYELFIELCLSMSEDNAILAFILPDSIFLPEHQRLREYLLEETEIKMISRLGEGFFPNIFRACTVLVLEKKKPSKDAITKCVRLNKSLRDKILKGEINFSEAEGNVAHSVKQARFYNDKESRFDIDVKLEEEYILKKIEKDPLDWSEEFHTGRGVEISKKGYVIECPICGNSKPKPQKEFRPIRCEKCNIVINKENWIEKKIVSKEPFEQWLPFTVGEDVKRYETKPKHYIKPNVLGINYKYGENLLAPKIIVRKTGVGINATYDRMGFLTSQTVFYFKLKDDLKSLYTHEYVLGVLNSRVMLFYYLKKYGDSEWKSHAYITQKIIKQLCIPKIDKMSSDQHLRQVKAITDAVISLLNSKEYSLELDLKIECLVAGLYDLTKKECKIINETIKEAQQLKAISALTLPNDIAITPKKVL